MCKINKNMCKLRKGLLFSENMCIINMIYYFYILFVKLLRIGQAQPKKYNISTPSAPKRRFEI